MENSGGFFVLQISFEISQTFKEPALGSLAQKP
jgi:hypothetical protein